MDSQIRIWEMGENLYSVWSSLGDFELVTLSQCNLQELAMFAAVISLKGVKSQNTTYK